MTISFYWRLMGSWWRRIMQSAVWICELRRSAEYENRLRLTDFRSKAWLFGLPASGSSPTHTRTSETHRLTSTSASTTKLKTLPTFLQFHSNSFTFCRNELRAFDSKIESEKLRYSFPNVVMLLVGQMPITFYCFEYWRRNVGAIAASLVSK